LECLQQKRHCQQARWNTGATIVGTVQHRKVFVAEKFMTVVSKQSIKTFFTDLVPESLLWTEQVTLR
jgi:hypothetical protein